ncbi:MAG: CoA pyrophosphatase [Ardenticatenia bacterium]|nr:MAG: CoA pyrophosphatase [Ardenticatenia bacterium]
MTPTLDWQLIEQLQERLRHPLPGLQAHLTMAPSSRATPESLLVQGKPCREAAVLVLLFPVDGAPHTLLTVRRAHLSHHAGQVSFPGGRCEEGETFAQTALREAHEEIGLSAESVNLIGTLSPIYVPPSNFCVYPQVALADTPPHVLSESDEVQCVLFVPLAHFLTPRHIGIERWNLRDAPVHVPVYYVEPYKVWGATAMILAELLTILRELNLKTNPTNT